MRTLHLSADLARDRATLPAPARHAGAQHAAALQRLPHRSDRRGDRARRQARLRFDALGPGALLVVEAAQGTQARDLQRAGRNRHREAVLPRAVQAPPLPDPGVGLLRVARHARGKQPHHFTRRDGELVTIAGLWDRWRDKAAGGETITSCTMVITEPNDFVRELHDRMPVILEPGQFEPWLSGEAGVEMLKPVANDVLRRWPVSKRVNSSRAPADDPTLMEEIELREVAK